ncbi:MAG: hypothetical protein IJS61_08615 [Firmicutes bacterium]|nr:hypothetical protein [Bacillota bacterium]
MNITATIYGILNQSHNISVSLPLIHAIGNNEALLFQALISKHNYYCEKGMLDDNGYFYATALDIEVSTGLSQRQQKALINNLEEIGLIDTVRKGMPAKKYFKLTENMTVLAELITRGIEKLNALKTEKKAVTATVSHSFDKMSNQVSTECQNKNEQNVQTCIDIMSNQESTKCSNMYRHNVDEKHIYKSNIKNHINKNHINKSINQSIVADKDAYRQERDRLREKIAENINIFNQIPSLETEDILENGKFKVNLNTEGYQWQSMYFEAFNIICDVVTAKGNKPYIICGHEYSQEVVRSVFMKLTEDHICAVLESLMAMTEPVRNMRKYLISSLYNSLFTLNTTEMQGTKPKTVDTKLLPKPNSFNNYQQREYDDTYLERVLRAKGNLI